MAILNITLARKTVGSRIRNMSEKMKHVETILTNRKKGNGEEGCDSSNCLINIDSDDELGESADSFNNLVMTLSEVLDLNSEIQLFSEMLTSHLELEVLSRESLNQLIKNTGAIGGAILAEKSGDLVVEASESIKDPVSLENNERILNTMKTHQHQLIHFPDDMIINGIIVDFRPKEMLLEPSLYNRRFGSIRLQEEFSRATRDGKPFSLLMFDIDHFKIVNDTYGHPVGDKVLANVSKIALGSIREGDVLVRYGGGFLCILPGASQHDATIVAERIRIMVMDSHVMNLEQEIKVTISLGVATYPHDHIYDSDQLIKHADEAMYVAKNTGRNRIVSYSTSWDRGDLSHRE